MATESNLSIDPFPGSLSTRESNHSIAGWTHKELHDALNIVANMGYMFQQI
jgi:hypothetical protein